MTYLAAVVEKARTQAAIGSLRAEGVYDDDRSVFEASGETVAIPVTETPTETQVLKIIREEGEPRLRTLADHLQERGWTDAQIETAPSSWAVLGSVILVEMGETHDPEAVGEALLAMHGQADTVLSRGGIDGQHREPDVTVVAGEGDTETVHREHGTEYAMDLAEVMFSPGNKAERAKMGDTTREDERVLDMFAGIGYFTLPMARAGAHVTAIEHNPDSFQYLLENTMRNGVSDHVEPYRADNRDVLDSYDGEQFDRVVMGYYDASEPCSEDSQTESDQSYEYLSDALSVLAPGGTLHMHEATPEALVPDRPVGRLEDAAAELGRSVEILDVREVKGYSEGVVHVVVDARVN